MWNVNTTPLHFLIEFLFGVAGGTLQTNLELHSSLVQKIFFLDLRSDLRICFSVGQN